MLDRMRPLLVLVTFLIATAGLVPVTPLSASAESAAGLQADTSAALNSLYRQTPSARVLAEHARAVLVFPNIVKAGFIVGAQYGQGMLLKGGKASGYYNSVQGSVGYQAGVEKFGYAMFLMSDASVRYLNKTDGWELGIGPEIVIVDQGAAAQLSTTTAKKDIYAFHFDQKGLMGGVSIQGTKVTHIHK